MPEMRKVNYCHNCGRHIGHQAQACMFCSARVRRSIRPERHCPFCDEVISPKAVKCPHCNEFVDGRATPREEVRATGKQIYRVDIPASDPTGARAIGGPRAMPPGARAIGGPSMKALPAPGASPSLPPPSGSRSLPPRPAQGRDDSVVDVDFSSGGRSMTPERAALPAPDGAPADDRALAIRAAAAAAVRKSAQRGLPILKRAAIAIWKSLRKKPPAPEPTLEAEIENPEDRFIICAGCSTECLAEDRFCYHCGATLAARPFEYGDRLEGPPSNAFLNVVIVVCVAAYVLAEPLLKASRPQATLPTQLAAGGLAPLLAIWGFMRKPGFFSRLLSLLLFFFVILALYVFLPNSIHDLIPAPHTPHK